MSNEEDNSNLEASECMEHKSTQNSESSNESSDDFGNFSDASFENDSEDDIKEFEVDALLDDLIPTMLQNDDETLEEEAKDVQLEDLIRNERPHVIYEQLVQLRTVLRPFIWKKSHLKASLWHILNLSEGESLEENLKKKQEPLDDSLFIEIRALSNDSAIKTNYVLRDHFKMEYSTPLTPVAMHSIEEQDQEKEIPKYLAMDLEKIENLKDYHDSLCHAIDVLFVELQTLKETEVGLLKDKATFESVVTNLTGHTQRLYRDEIAFYNKKVRKKNKFGW